MPARRARGRRSAGSSRSCVIARDALHARDRAAPPLAGRGAPRDLPSPSARRRASRRRPPHRACRGRARRARPPSRSSPTRPAPCRAPRARSSCTIAVTCSASRADASGTRWRDDRQFLLERRIVDPLIQAAALQRVVHLARAVGGEDDERRLGRPHRAELGNRDLEFGEQLEQKPFELLVGAIDLVDQQDGRTRARRIDRLQQRPLDEKRFAVELAVARLSRSSACGRVEDPQLEQLARVVPFVERVADVEAFVALQANQIGVERGGDRGGQRGLADARLALEKQRSFQAQREKQRNREPGPPRIARRRGAAGDRRWMQEAWRRWSSVACSRPRCLPDRDLDMRVGPAALEPAAALSGDVVRPVHAGGIHPAP